MNVVIQLFLYDWSKCRSDAERLRKELRILEYGSVLLQNCADPNIKKVHVLCETQEAADYYESISAQFSHKTVFVNHGKQPTYQELMEYIKKTFTSKEIVCLMNADMFFNSERDHELIQKHLGQNDLFALTRHEITDDGHKTHTNETCPFTVHGGSCDTFIFYTPLPDTLDLSKMNFRQNLFGAEAVFMKAWVDAGYKLLNPCDEIITLHQHQGRVHFETYATIDTPTNSVMNFKTFLSNPSHTNA